jgi:hypothetical protein
VHVVRNARLTIGIRGQSNLRAHEVPHPEWDPKDWKRVFGFATRDK